MPFPDDLRLLFNGDVNFLFARDYRTGDKRGQPYDGSELEAYVDRLADHGVQAHLINVNGQLPWYLSDKLDHVLTGYTRGDRDYVRPHYPPTDETFSEAQLQQRLNKSAAMLDRYLDLKEAGVDWVQRMIDRNRHHGMSPWISLRMNDAHGANNWAASFFNMPTQRDPATRLSGRFPDPQSEPLNNRQLASYDHAGTRDYYLTMIAEVIERYDPAGLELDWLRTAHCCEPPVSPESQTAMSAWMAQVRDVVGDRPLSLRTPPHLELLADIGLDVITWARDGLFDAITPGNFFQCSWELPFDHYRVLLGPKVKLLGVIEGAPNWMFARPAAEAEDADRPSYRVTPVSPPLVHGAAANKWAGGVDAIEFYNFFVADEDATRPGVKPGSGRYDAIADTASPETLRDKPQHYTLATASGGWMYPEHEHAPHLPTTIEPSQHRTFSLAMLPPSSLASATVHVVLEADKAADASHIGLGVNSHHPSFASSAVDDLLFPLGLQKRYAADHAALAFRLNAAQRGQLQDGQNRWTLYNDGDTAIKVVGFEVGLEPTS